MKGKKKDNELSGDQTISKQ